MTNPTQSDIFIDGHPGNAWLAQTIEPTLEPGLPICDPHHHLWPETATRTPYTLYLLPELAKDLTSGHDIRSTVYVEARSMYHTDGPEELRSVGEVAFADNQAIESATGLHGPSNAIAAVIGRANLQLGDAVPPVLDALQAASPTRFRGIRHSVTSDPHAKAAGSTNREPGILGEPASREGAHLLASRGLTFEAWLYHPQLRELANFARAVPELTIILNHVGGLTRVGPYADDPERTLATWRDGIADVASCPNVVVKLGGLGLPRTGFDFHVRETPIGSEEIADALAPFIHYCIDQFGPSRGMFESNFPVDKVSYVYPILWNAFKRLSVDFPAADRAALFHDTATRVYRIEA
jgi:predicted TIM-barrel fold metal-dependent hydrolase